MKTREANSAQPEPIVPGRAGESQATPSSRRLAWVVLLIALIASAGGWLISLQHSRLGDEMRFREEVDGARAVLVERLAAYESFLHGAGGLFAASQSVQRQEWKAYVEGVSGDQRFPGLDALGYVERVSREKVDFFEKATRADGRPGFKVNIGEGEGDLLVIKFLEPEEGRQGVLGQCINGDRFRMAAAEAARDRGQAVVSGQVRLSDNLMGFVMMLPIYESGKVPTSEEARRRLFQGLVYARFNLDQLLTEVFRRPASALRIRVFDGYEDSPEALIYDSGSPEGVTDHYAPAFTERVVLPMGGRAWMLDFSSLPAFDASASRLFSTLAGLGGIVVSLLLFGIVWSLSQTRERAMAMAEGMTAALRGANRQLEKEIADRERAQQSTKDSEAQYHSLVENLPLNILRKDLQGKFTFANQRFCSELGKSLEEILGKTEFELFPAEQAARHKQEEDRILESGATLEEVQELRLSGSDLRFVQVIKTPLRDSAGEVIGLQGIFWDVTDKHRTEKELERERELLHTLLDNVPDRIYFKDEESRFLRVSRAMADLFKVGDPSEVVGRSDFEFFGEEHARKAYDDEQRIIRTGQPVIGLVEQEDMPGGAQRWASTTKMPMRNDQGRVIGTFGISRDVTPMMEAEAEARRTNERLERVVADLERAQQSMKDSEVLYHSLVENLPLSIYRKDLEGRFTFSNQRFSNELGKPVEDILGRTEFDLLAPEQASQHQAEDVRIIESGSSLEEIQELQLPEADVRFVQVIKTPLRDGAGNVIGLQGIFWDVTDKHRAERDLQYERDLLHTLMDNLPDRIYFKDRQSHYIRNSRAHLERLGLTEARDAIGKSDFDFFTEEHARQAYEDEQLLMRTGETLVKEEKLIRPDGSVAWALSTKLPLRDKQGNTVGTFGISHDITGMKVAEEKLQRERDLLYALLDNIPDRIYFKDRQSRILRMSRAHADLFELKDPNEAVGKTDFDFFTEEHARQAFDDEQRIIRTGEPVIGLVEKETLPGGVIRWASTTKMPLRSKEGGIVGTFGITRDITDMKRTSDALKRAKEAAEEANRTKSQFLANMSHELRTPLNSIIGFSNIMLKNKAGNLAAAEASFLDRILSNGKHLLELINQILDLSKIEARKVELQVSPVRIDQLVRETVAQQEGLVRERPVVLRCDLPDQVAPMQTDPDKLRQVLINLIGNSLKFTEKGSVTLRVITDVRDHRPVRIDVVDTGIGIPRQKLGAIFQAFQQAEATTARRFGGTGLGLTISQALCELMGHRIEVASEAGRGSTFSILLGSQPDKPALPAPPVPAPTRVASGGTTQFLAANLRGKRVLVIDDEADSRLLLRHTLQEFGCDVVEAASGEEGLRAARRHHPDLITVDLMMPRMTGSEVVGAIKSDPELKHIPVVVVSIVSGEHRGHILGAVELLQKPVVREELLATLLRCLPQRLLRILVVDDEEGSRELMRSLLELERFEVRAVGSGREARDALDQSPCDLILLDLMMPEMDGFDFLRTLRSEPRFRNLPVVVVTAKDLSRREAEELRQNASDVVQKSAAFNQDLKDVLRRLCKPVIVGSSLKPGPAAPNPE